MISPLTTIGIFLSVLYTTSGAPIALTAPAPIHIAPTQAVQDYSVQAASTVANPLPTSTGHITLASFKVPELQPQTLDLDISEQELRLVGLINREREADGESDLTDDALLNSVALKHSEDMCVRNYFDHYAPSPGPVTPMDRYLAARGNRPEYAMVGENIYYRSASEDLSETADEAHTAFMHSPGHRANILQGQYTKVGIGIYRNPHTGEFWVTEMFCTVSQPK